MEAWVGNTSNLGSKIFWIWWRPMTNDPPNIIVSNLIKSIDWGVEKGQMAYIRMMVYIWWSQCPISILGEKNSSPWWPLSSKRVWSSPALMGQSVGITITVQCSWSPYSGYSPSGHGSALSSHGRSVGSASQWLLRKPPFRATHFVRPM